MRKLNYTRNQGIEELICPFCGLLYYFTAGQLDSGEKLCIECGAPLAWNDLAPSGKD